MVASTDIRYYVHTNQKAPQLENAYGSMLNVLDACLVNGFGSQTVDSLTANGTTVTADFGKAHNLLRFQVIKIDGAVQDEFNGEHRILDVTTNTITFEIVQPASTNRASGLISCSLPPLGWEKPFASQNPSGGGKGAYRSKNTLLPSRPFLRVVDELDPLYNINWAKYAKVGIVEDMLDIDTIMGKQVPFDHESPNKNWIASGSGTNVINGWAKWFYATPHVETISFRTSGSIVPNGQRDWVIIGNNESFYIFNRTHTNTTYPYHRQSYCFALLEQDYLSSYVLSALNDNDNSPIILYQHNPIIYPSSPFPFFCYNQYNKSWNVRSLELIGSSSGFASSNNILPSKDIPVFSLPIFVSENKRIPRGKLPLIEFLTQTRPFIDLQCFNMGNRAKIAINCMVNSPSEYGQVLFDLGDLV